MAMVDGVATLSFTVTLQKPQKDVDDEATFKFCSASLNTSVNTCDFCSSHVLIKVVANKQLNESMETVG